MLTDITPPALEPISRDEAKLFLRIDHTDENALIDMLIRSARERLEAYLNVAMIIRPMRLETTAAPEVSLPRWPVQSVDGVIANGQVIRGYRVDLRRRPATVKTVSGGTVSINFTAGYGETADAVPAPLRQAMLLLISQAYEAPNKAQETIPLMVDALTLPYRVIGL